MDQVKKEVNWLSYAIASLDKVGTFSRWTNILGIAILFLMVCFTFVEVFARYVFNAPIKGTLEITEVMMAVAVFLAIAHTQNVKAHVSVDLINAMLTPKPKLILEFINIFLGLGVFIILIWQSIVKALYYLQKNSLHGGQSGITIPEAPFEFVVVLGCSALSLLLLRDLLKLIENARKNHLIWHNWLLMIGIPILIILASIFWIQPNLIQVSLPMVGLMGVIASLILFLMGMPIAFALILTSFLFIGHI
ncbi:MAG: TRAP transporter small permease [Dehalococcoidales bacterium]|nr:TRAP transporter small permease [Dehalococcoidales bacterium]